jgi:predicted dehydrogenase
MIVQKPLAPDWAEAVAIVETAAEAGVPLAVHENFRFQAPMRRVREVLDSGEIGPPSWARIAFRTGYDVYRTQPYFYGEERLAILDVGIHVLDLARVFLGEVERVSCETQRRNPRVRAEDTATMLLRHEGGAVSVVECTYESRALPDPFPQTLLRIEGPAGPSSCTRLPDGRSPAAAAPARSRSARRCWPGRRALARGAGERAPHPAPHRGRAPGRPRSPETTGEDNLRTFALVEAAYVAAATGRAVTPRRWKPPTRSSG